MSCIEPIYIPLALRMGTCIVVTVSRVTYFILRAYTGTGASHSQHSKNSGDVSEKCWWIDRKGRYQQRRNL